MTTNSYDMKDPEYRGSYHYNTYGQNYGYDNYNSNSQYGSGYDQNSSSQYYGSGNYNYQGFGNYPNQSQTQSNSYYNY